MGERVSIREGLLPIVFVAPHGYNDQFTDIIVEVASEKLDCHAVINRGWERADQVDIQNDKANCNSITHCYEDVVKDEFLDPLLRFAIRSQNIIHANAHKWTFLDNPLVITIHGVGNDIRKKAKGDLDFILGTGLGNPNRPTCEFWKKNALADILTDEGVDVWEGKSGGPFAAWGKDNLNQLFVQKHPGLSNSIQIEIIKSPWRDTDKRARGTGCILANALKRLLTIQDFSPFKVAIGLPII